jgi:hypothetical protein
MTLEMCLLFSLQRLSEIFLILRAERSIALNVHAYVHTYTILHAVVRF